MHRIQFYIEAKEGANLIHKLPRFNFYGQLNVPIIVFDCLSGIKSYYLYLVKFG